MSESLLTSAVAPDPDTTPGAAGAPASEPREITEDDGDPDPAGGAGGDAPAPAAVPPAKGPVSLSGAELAQLRELRRRQREAAAEIELAKEQLKEARAGWEAATGAISRYIDSLAQDLPLFERPRDGEPIDASYTTPDGTYVGMEVTIPAEDWRRVPLVEAISGHVGETILQKLHEAELYTVGDLADFTAGDCRLTDIQGIGPAKAAQIEEALEAFWAARKAAGQDPENEAAGDEAEAQDPEGGQEGASDAADE